MNRSFTGVVALIISLMTSSFGQGVRVYTSDIGNFWTAYDSIQNGGDAVKVIQSMYIDKGTEGLKDFIRTKKFTAQEYAIQLKQYLKFWASIKTNTLSIARRSNEIEKVFSRFKEIYPQFKPPVVYFTIGCLRSGGTTRKDKILIGAEIASANETTDMSEFQGWLKSVMGQTGDIVTMVAHEAVHTQQKFGLSFIWGYMNHQLLTQSLNEGAADFVSSLVVGQTINKSNYEYGVKYEMQLWGEFQYEMMGNGLSKWLYNGGNIRDRPADLGYFIGNRICQSYYTLHGSGADAIRQILRMSYSRKFIRKSGYLKN